jgi:hypothetical protein
VATSVSERIVYQTGHATGDRVCLLAMAAGGACSPAGRPDACIEMLLRFQSQRT